MSSLTVHGLTKVYGEKTAIQNIHFSVGRGRICGLIGPNGAGKTTTVKIVVGLMRSDRGEVVWDGQIVQPRSPFLHKIGHVPDEPFIYDKLTGRELLRLVAVLKGMDRLQGEEAIADFGDQLELRSVLDQVAETYSRGTRRKIGLVAGLLKDPDLLVMDEPTESLDPMTIRWLGCRLRAEASRGRAILISTHNLSWAESICSDIAMLHEGRLLFAGDLEEIHRRSDPSESLEKMFLRAVHGT